VVYEIIINKEKYPTEIKPTPARPKKRICMAVSMILKNTTHLSTKKGSKGIY
jgi:hypothetical protein